MDKKGNSQIVEHHSDSDEKSESKKVERKDKDKYTDILSQADSRRAGKPAKLTEEEQAKLAKELQAMTKDDTADLAPKTLKDADKK